MQFGLLVVSASRSRPCPRPARGRLREADRGLPLGESRSWSHSSCGRVVGVVCAMEPLPAWAETRPSRGSGPRVFWLKHLERRNPRTRARPRPPWAAGRPNLFEGMSYGNVINVLAIALFGEQTLTPLPQ